MSNHVDRFFAAVSALAAHGHIKQRLIRAYQDNLAEIEVDELPAAIKQPFADLRASMHRVEPSNGEGPICASVRKMSEVEADACSRQMVELFGDMVRMADNTVESVPPNNDLETSVPPFLIKSG